MPTLAAILNLGFFSLGLLSSLPAPANASDLAVKDAQGTTLFSYGASHALLIWAGDYQNPFWKKLNNLRNEANEVKAALERQGFQVEVIANPASQKLRNAFEDFIQRYGFNPDNRLVIYYAGHGWTRKGDLGYLVPVDAPDASSVQGDLEFAKQALSMEQIISWSKQMEARHVLFIFDSCFSGAIFKVRSASPPPSYLERKMSLPVRQFITAGDTNEVVPATSIFTPVLIRGLDGAADFNHDGYVTGSELGEYLPQAMSDYTKAQNPQYGKIRDPDLDEGDIVFRSLAPSAAPSTGILSPQPPPKPKPARAGPSTPIEPPPTGQAGTAIRPSRPQDQRLAPSGSPGPPAHQAMVTAESLVNRDAAAAQARQRLPEGAIEHRSQCSVISVAGSDRFRCSIWFSVAPPGESGSAP